MYQSDSSSQKSAMGLFYKAKFLLGKVYLQEQDFIRLENIYAEEAKRLLAKERKDSACQLYLDFAELFCQKQKDLDFPKPDYDKALDALK